MASGLTRDGPSVPDRPFLSNELYDVWQSGARHHIAIGRKKMGLGRIKKGLQCFSNGHLSIENSLIRRALSVFPISSRTTAAQRFGDADKVTRRLRQAGSLAPDHAYLHHRERAGNVTAFDAVAFQRPGAVDQIRQ